jgi:uncharacterized protein YecE (DUF72 family)
VYPAAHPAGFHPLSFLARYFDTIEINSSFYAMPRREHAERWVRLVADRQGFRFLVKLNRDLTHETSGVEAERWPQLAAEFLNGIEPIAKSKKLGAILAQFPVSFRFGPEEVRRLGRLHALLSGPPLVLEVRHASWFAPPALDTIRGLGFSLAYVDLPASWDHPPDWHAPTGAIGYLRLHGRNSSQWFRRGAERDDKYDYLYGESEIEAIARKAERIATVHDETSVVTNNHFEGKAVANALEILSALRGEAVPAPSEIVASFPHLQAHVRVEGQQQLF